MHSEDVNFSIDKLNTLVDAGGPVVVALIGMSVIGLAVLLIKLWQFHSLKLERRDFIDDAIDAWRRKDTQSLQQILSESKNPIARVIQTAANTISQNMDHALAREEVVRVATLELANTRSYLRIIEVIAALSPLLGLFGTVLGMIEAFARLESAGTAVDPAVLSGGIWEALLTTAAGLAVAIPAIMALNWLEHRIDNFKLAMEDAMTRMFTSTAINID